MKAFFPLLRLPALFFSLLTTLFLPAACAAADHAVASSPARQPINAQENRRLIDVLESGDLAMNRWYWTGDWAAPTNTTMGHPAKPWLTAEKAVLVPVASHYTRPEGGVWPFHGYLLDTLEQPDGRKRVVFKNKILLRHLVDRTNITDGKMLSAMGVDEKAPGVYVYWKKGGAMTEFSLDEAPFAKSYFRALVSTDASGTRTYRVNRVDTMPIQYIAFAYYPSGAVKEITYVMRAQTGREPFFYTWKVAYSDDVRNPQKTGETAKSLVPPRSPLWLPNMLKTAG